MDNDPRVFCGGLQGDSDRRPPSVKILHVFGRMDRGGAEMRTLELMRKLRHSDVQFQFCVLSGLPGELDDEIRELGGQVHLLPLGPLFSIRFKRLLLKHSYDVVHSHVHYFSGHIIKLASVVGTPIRVAHFRSVRDGHGDHLLRRFYRLLMQHWTDRFATHILAVSKSVMAAAWKSDWQEEPRCRVIYNGLDTGPFVGPRNKSGVLHELALPQDSSLLVHVGRMTRPKNHMRVVAIFGKIAQLVPGSRLLLIGRGGNDIEARIRRRVTQLGLTSRVVFLGERTDVPRLLKASDLMIFPSLWEGLPGACLEACIAGTPVLASDLPGIREIAQHFPDVHCLGLDEDDSEWALVAKGLLDGKNEERSIDTSVREFSKSVFALENCMKAHLEVWKARSS